MNFSFFLLVFAYLLNSCGEKAIPKYIPLEESDNPFVLSSTFKFVKGHYFYNQNFDEDKRMGVFIYEFRNLNCPDGLPARFRLVVDTQKTSPGPVVHVYHGGTFDFERGGPWGGSHIISMNKLTQVWGIYKMESFIGSSHIVDGGAGGTVAAVLSQNRVTGVFLENCWGDMGYNRSYGTRLNNSSQEDFVRAGLEAAETLVDEFNSQTLANAHYVWGMSAGGHAAYEVLNSKKTIISKAVFDCPADYLMGYYTAIEDNVSNGNLDSRAESPLKDALSDYFIKVFSATNTINSTTLTQDTLAHKLQNDTDFENFKIYYLYSTEDPIVPTQVTVPAKTQIDNIKTATPAKANNFCVNTKTDFKHVFTNDSMDETNKAFNFIMNGICAI